MSSSNGKTRKPKNGTDETALVVWQVPKKLKRRFKAKLAASGMSIKDSIIGHMNNVCSAPKHEPSNA